jgi:hypothetical protein
MARYVEKLLGSVHACIVVRPIISSSTEYC